MLKIHPTLRHLLKARIFLVKIVRKPIIEIKLKIFTNNEVEDKNLK